MITDECVADIAGQTASAEEQPTQAAQTGLRRLSAIILMGAVVGALLGARNMVLWVEDWPAGSATNHALEIVNAWQETTQKVCLADVHPTLRHAARSVEALGTDEPPPEPEWPEHSCRQP